MVLDTDGGYFRGHCSAARAPPSTKTSIPVRSGVTPAVSGWPRGRCCLRRARPVQQQLPVLGPREPETAKCPGRRRTRAEGRSASSAWAIWPRWPYKDARMGVADRQSHRVVRKSASASSNRCRGSAPRPVHATKALFDEIGSSCIGIFEIAWWRDRNRRSVVDRPGDQAKKGGVRIQRDRPLDEGACSIKPALERREGRAATCTRSMGSPSSCSAFSASDRARAGAPPPALRPRTVIDNLASSRPPIVSARWRELGSSAIAWSSRAIEPRTISSRRDRRNSSEAGGRGRSWVEGLSVGRGDGLVPGRRLRT